MTESLEREFVQLWSRCQAGDAAAQQRLFELYGSDLRRCVRVHLRDPRLRRIADSMDLCQTVVRRLIAGSERYEFTTFAHFQALVSKIVRSRVAKMREKLLHQLMAERAVSEHRWESGSAGDAERVEELSELRQFLRCVLSPEEMRWFVACFEEGQTYVQIASVEGVSADAIRKRLQRIKVLVREALEGSA